MSLTVVIVGAGQAASSLVSSLRSEGFDGRIVLIGEESHPPYQRPPLSKKYLGGDMELEKVYIKTLAAYEKAQVELILGARAESIDRIGHRVQLDDGREISYDKLALTTGSRVRELPVPGAHLEGVCYLRTLDDVHRIQRHLGPGKRLVIVGGGYVGLEAAAIAVKMGAVVSILELSPRVLQRVVAPVVSRFFEDLHRAEGVDIYTNTQVTAFEGNAGVEQVLCADGRCFPADLVIVGIGILPNSEIAAEAGLDTDDGILVDEYAQTSDPDIVAAGDCTNHPNSKLDRRLRLESVQNALDQAKTAAATLCGKRREYASIPRFWSDQYDLRLQISGLAQDYDEVLVHGEPAERSFAALYLRNGRLIAVDAVNDPKVFARIRPLVAEQAPFGAEQLAELKA